MDLDEALYTTRAMRRVTTEPVSLAVQEKILDAAIRAPNGGNTQGWRFLLVDDEAVKAQLAPLYREAMTDVWRLIYADRLAAANADPDTPESRTMLATYHSAEWLAENFASIPLFLFAFSQFDPTGGSIYPAVWSAQLAARAEGIGSALTSAGCLLRGEQTCEVLGVPKDEGWIATCCVSFGHPTGRWGVAQRRPVHEVSYRNQWGADVGFEVPAPLWSPVE